MNISYENGYASGEMRRTIPGYDPRWDYVDAMKTGKDEFAEFKRGFDDGLEGREKSP